MKLTFYSFCLLALIYSCSDSAVTPEDSNLHELAMDESQTMLKADSGMYQMELILPKTLLSPEAKFKHRESFGDVELYLNESFHVFISEEETDLAHVKEELNSEVLFSRTYLDEQDNELLYESKLPDGTSVGYGWVQHRKAGERDFIIKVNPQVTYTKSQIRIIQETLNTLRII